jgi:hypothetical protein
VITSTTVNKSGAIPQQPTRHSARATSHQRLRSHGHMGPQPEGRWVQSHAEAPPSYDVDPPCRRRWDRFFGSGGDEVEVAAGAVAEVGGERFGEEEQPRGRRRPQEQGLLR